MKGLSKFAHFSNFSVFSRDGHFRIIRNSRIIILNLILKYFCFYFEKTTKIYSALGFIAK